MAKSKMIFENSPYLLWLGIKLKMPLYGKYLQNKHIMQPKKKSQCGNYSSAPLEEHVPGLLQQKSPIFLCVKPRPKRWTTIVSLLDKTE